MPSALENPYEILEVNGFQLFLYNDLGRPNLGMISWIWSPYFTGDPQVVKWPLSFQIAACACSIRKSYLESV